MKYFVAITGAILIFLGGTIVVATLIGTLFFSGLVGENLFEIIGPILIILPILISVVFGAFAAILSYRATLKFYGQREESSSDASVL